MARTPDDTETVECAGDAHARLRDTVLGGVPAGDFTEAGAVGGVVAGDGEGPVGGEPEEAEEGVVAPGAGWGGGSRDVVEEDGVGEGGLFEDLAFALL